MNCNLDIKGYSPPNMGRCNDTALWKLSCHGTSAICWQFFSLAHSMVILCLLFQSYAKSSTKVCKCVRTRVFFWDHLFNFYIVDYYLLLHLAQFCFQWLLELVSFAVVKVTTEYWVLLFLGAVCGGLILIYLVIGTISVIKRRSTQKPKPD
jgi:hypothetical protein